jgi:hypothetical protein
MERPEDYAMGDMSRTYCRHCARPDGSMQSYDEKLAGLGAFIVRTQGLDPGVARHAAAAMMAGLPAWKDQPGSTRRRARAAHLEK